MARNSKYALLTVLLLVALPVLAGDEVVKDGVLHIMNGTEPSGPGEIVELEEVWRRGNDDDEEFFGMISRCVVADDGTIYLLDTNLSEVPVYSSDGERLATLSREGDGPGEVRGPFGLLFMPDGNLGVMQVSPGKIVKISTAGVPAGVVTPTDPTTGGYVEVYDCVSGGRQVVVTAEKRYSENDGHTRRHVNFIAAFDDEGHETVRYFENVYIRDFRNLTFDESAVNRIDFHKTAVGQDGRVYVAHERDDYLISVFSADGKLDRVIEREYTHRERDKAEYNRVKSNLEGVFMTHFPDADIVTSTTEPDIDSLHFGYDGNLWVFNSYSGFKQPEGVLATWDVFSPDGHFIKTVSAKCVGDGLNDYMIWTPEGNAVLVTHYTDAMHGVQNRGGRNDEDDDDDGDGGEAAPMEIVYLKAVD